MRKNKLLIFISVILIGAFMVTGCSFSTVATVNGEKITQAMVDQQTRLYIADFEFQYQAPFDKEKSKILYQQFENNAKRDLIKQSMLLQEAKKRGLTASDAEVNKTLEGAKVMLGDSEKNKGYQNYLKALKMNETEFKATLKKQILAGKVEDEVTKDVTVSDTEVVEYYIKHKAEYKKLLPEIKDDVTKDALKAKKQKTLTDFGAKLQKAATIEVK
ncbi:MAG: SurA N-terminal domain-containing protein [Methylocystaceae bacterium]